MASNTTSGSSPERFDEIFSSFTKLSPTIYIRDKPTSASPSPESPRETICLLFWMDAAPRHTAKYINEYIKVLPNARIICMRTLSTDLMFRGSKKSHRLRVVPLVSALCASDGPMHFHVFSNGGVFSLHHVAAEYRTSTGKPLPTKSLIFDSAPGRHALLATARAFSYGLPQFFLFRMVGLCVIWAVLISHWLACKLRRETNAIDLAGDEINDPTLIDLGAKRCYIYSKTDELVDWKHVEENVAQAKSRGWEVSAELFNGPHVGHMRSEPERYWKLVWGLVLRNVTPNE
ncbi:conserved hypothetical protein [Histoplasma capsulatum G186AR]|uniref:Indole-diterpene biosynthesis protein PaxU n=2 Tax=Ajellomyces capsulatus TaxID=5037 RepID=C0P060_AJECG|nr:uncharacterized protein HCBG_08779 [Histoplasma capsulatum G186AR]EEH02876.1 conserved hypothetical protein [Histoplasma capsulatum G186AR]KAG5295948.1 indole-diterpene biosynthesis protein PaxU [Histoplasma capsulatum]QSS73931.1 indole-diterpene biosynthesis protein PaxU [Histoplasma capsulatum G186AR]